MRRVAVHHERLKFPYKRVALRLVLSATLLVLILILSFFYFLPSLLRTDTSKDGDADDWFSWAEVAWRYYQPGVGVNSATGLHYAKTDWQRFTDWDLGVYISAIIDAERLGLISREGLWGSDYRLEKILNFLETRPITGERLPYAQYDASTGSVPDDVGNRTAHPSDSAKLLLALDDLRRFRSDFAGRIELIVARHDFDLFAKSGYFATDDIYPFYAAQGYWAFGFSTPTLKEVEDLGGGNTVDVYGENIPRAYVTSEPLMLAILENRTNDLYKTCADSVFLAQQKRYESTGKLTAFSEGSYPAPHNYVYEWVVAGTGETWLLTAGGKIDKPEVIYTKIAFAFHAVYDNEYTRKLVNLVLPLATERGFLEGVMEDGKTVDALSDKTNGMILQAARYFIFSKPTIASFASSPVLSKINVENCLLFKETFYLKCALLGDDRKAKIVIHLKSNFVRASGLHA